MLRHYGGIQMQILLLHRMYFQVFIFYGPRSNSELLMHSGFVCDDNAHDRLAVRMGQWTAAITS